MIVRAMIRSGWFYVAEKQWPRILGAIGSLPGLEVMGAQRQHNLRMLKQVW